MRLLQAADCAGGAQACGAGAAGLVAHRQGAPRLQGAGDSGAQEVSGEGTPVTADLLYLAGKLASLEVELAEARLVGRQLCGWLAASEGVAGRHVAAVMQRRYGWLRQQGVGDD